jgi:hypothetical protein
MTERQERAVTEDVVRAYVDAWNAADESSRIALLERCWAVDGKYVDPQVEAEGRRGVDRIIAAYHKHRSGFAISIDGPIDAHHGMFRFVWSFTNDEVTLDGMEFGAVREGLIASVTRFFGSVPPAM